MKIKSESFLRIKVRKFIFNFGLKFENSGNGNINTNGELQFIKQVSEYFKNKYTKSEKIEVLDVGAHNGDWIEKIIDEFSIRDLDGKFHVFEPQRKPFQLLTDKFGRFDNVFLNNFALSDFEGECDIYANKSGSSLSSLYQRNLAEYKINMIAQEKVKLSRLENYLRDNNLKHIHLLKIDVEGHELSVLKGAGDFLNYTNVDFIQFEYGGTNIDARTTLFDFFCYFESRGFKVAKIMRKNLSIRKYSHILNDYQYANYVAVSKRIV